MDFRLKKKNDQLTLVSGFAMNLGFLIPLAITVWFTAQNPVISVWRFILFFIFLAGFSYREKWFFCREKTEYRFYLFFIPLIRKSLETKDISSITMKTFMRGQQTTTSPGSSRKWFQTEQGVLKLQKKDETEETLIMDTNRKNLKLVERGEEIAQFLDIPFLLNT